MPDVPVISLNNGTRLPQLGFGVFRVGDAEAVGVVGTALQEGYRSVDSAAGYENERGVGEAIARSGLPRGEVFVTTKLTNHAHGFDRALRAFDGSLELLGLDYVDLYLIHWPRPHHDLYVETWRALEKIYAGGRAKAIGVSNFQIPHLQRLLDETDIVPAVNQIELHPYLTQPELRAFHAEHGIVTEAWSPLAKGGRLLANPVVTTIAEKYARTPAQIVLRWHIQLGNMVIPKSVTASRIRENIDVFGFELAPDDVDAIADLNTGHRTGPDPDTFG
ncbi:MAG TPA: aldo/keto reductase [Jatrophihabitantaceae bacterium]